MTFKLHKPRNNCQTDCYRIVNAAYQGNFFGDGGKIAKDMTVEFFNWVQTASDYWSGYFILQAAENADYYVSFGEFMFIGEKDDADSMSLDNYFR